MSNARRGIAFYLETLLLLLFLLWREGDSFDWVLLAALALLFLRDGDS